MTMRRNADKEKAFLEALATSCNIRLACESSGLSRYSAYALRDKDPAFAEAWARAREMGAEALEDECMRRALDGVEKPVFYQGAVCGNVRHYSDALAVFLLKAALPQKYTDRVLDPARADIAERIEKARRRLRGQ